MDQPQQDESQIQNDVPVQATDQVGQVAAEPSREASTIPVTVVSSVGDESSHTGVAMPDETVAQSIPVAVPDELAHVASELESMSAQQVAEEPVAPLAEQDQADSPSQLASSGYDPMDQINAQEAAPSVAETEQFVGDMQVAEAPQEVVDESSELSDTSNVPVAEDASGTQEVPSAPETPVAVNEAVTMANQAVLEQEPARNPGELINDVIVPSAVAAAVAGGTAGENAITGTPEAAGTGVVQPVVMAAPHVKKSKKGLLILVVTLVVLLFGGAAVAVYMMQPKTKTTTPSTSATSTPAHAVTVTPAPGETATAKALDDYKVACGGGTVTNATDYKGASPHPVVFFEKGSDSKYAMSVVAFKDKTWAADATKVTTGQLAVCVSEKVAAEKKLKACPITDATTKVTTNVDYYSTTYTVDVYNAKTGAKVNSYESPSVDTTCPTTAVYDKASPKIVAKYDLTSLETLIKPDVTKVL